MGKNTRLALNGGKPAVIGGLTEGLAPFDTIGQDEAKAAYDSILKGPLSGYLGGEKWGGYHVETLERAWEEMFGVKHAIACNSATSGLLMACHAAGVGPGSHVHTTPYTMSGTVAPAAFLGAKIIFGDILEDIFCQIPHPWADIAITVNLFGHPSHASGKFVIEDAAQSILATRNGKRVSSADITVFSGNVHKQIQCGEGGMCVTNDDHLAEKMRYFRNHGELAGKRPGLNLRLTEIQAAIWLVQLKKAEWIVSTRVEIAKRLSEMLPENWIPPFVEEGCQHSYYVWAFRCHTAGRNWIAKALQAEGVPVRAGYVTPLYKLPAFQQDIHRPNVEMVEDSIIIYENCAYDPTAEQLKQIGEAFEKVADADSR